MQKQILLVTILFYTIISYAMEQPVQLIPRIVYNTNNIPYALEAKLTKKFSPQSKCPKIDDAFFNLSPEIKRIHSKDYLTNLDKNPSKMLATINNSYSWGWYSNAYSKTHFPSMLDNVSTTFAATECVIALNNNARFKPNYAIALAEGCSFAGHNCGNNGDVYAPIPIAAAYALEEHNNDIQRILIIDENITTNTIEYYFKHGNGSIFFPENNPQLSALFQDKIVMHHHVADELWNFLNNPDNTIDLAFYNINIDDVEPIEDLHPADAKERNLKIWSLFYHFIPTVFIFSGDKNNHQNATYSTIKYIAQTAQKIASLNDSRKVTQAYPEKPIDPLRAQIKKEFNEFMTDMQNFTASLRKYSLPIQIPSSIYDQFTDSENTQSYSSYSSSSCSDLEHERHRLKNKLGLYNYSSELDDDYQAAETSSTHDDGNDSRSYEDSEDEDNKI